MAAEAGESKRARVDEGPREMEVKGALGTWPWCVPNVAVPRGGACGELSQLRNKRELEGETLLVPDCQ